jgi:drug/metabolite transporter (DMT)-like permease
MKLLDNSSRTKAIFSVVLAAIIGGGIPVMGKIGLSIIPPYTFTFFRFLLASLCLFPFIHPLPKIPRQILGKIILISLLGTGNVTLFALGVRYTTATISQLLYAVVPVISLILVRLLYKENFSNQKIIGVITGFFGVLLLILLPVIAKGSAFSGTLQGNLTILTAVFSFSFYSVLSKKYQQYVTPQLLTFIFAITTLCVLLPFALNDFYVNPLWIYHLSSASIASTLYVGIMGGAVYYLLYQYAIKHGGPVVASLTMFLQPIAAYTWAVLLLHEKLTTGIFFGAILIILGARLVTMEIKSKPVPHK